MAEVTLRYTARLYVDVDTESGEVTKVVVDDSNTEGPEPYEPDEFDEAGDYDASDHNDAVGIAETGEWPAWEFGF